MDALLKDVKARYGRLDVVVANAVVDAHAPLARITEQQFDTMIGTNLKGVLFAVQSAVPLMSSGGSIILIGSTASVAPPPGMSIYGAIKAGFHGMVRALIQDLIEHVRVEIDGRMTTGEIGGGQPMRRGVEAVEDAGGCQHERASANRRHAGTALGRPTYAAYDRRGYRSIKVVDAGHNDGVCLGE